VNSLLIIGGSGFFGKSILEAFNLGFLDKFNICSITIVSRNAEALKITNPDLLTSQVSLVNDDIRICTKLPNADIVINAATSSSEVSYLANPNLEKNNILIGVNNFCKLSKKYLINSKILYVSSGAVYGNQPATLNNISESEEFYSLNLFTPTKRAYAEAKREAEFQIKNLGSCGFDVSIARCFSFVGKYLPLNTHFAIGNFIGNAKFSGEIKVEAKQNVYRSYMHTYDLAQWLLSIAFAASPQAPIYNVGSDFAITIHDLAKLIGERYGLRIYVPAIDSQVIDRYVPSITKIKKDLNLSIEYSLPQAIALTYDSI